MMVFGVVPREEDVAVSAGVLDGAKPHRERRAVFQCLELRFLERVVVGDMRPAVGLGDPQVGEQEGDGLRGHRRPPVCAGER
jgi:hypothetical protein